MKIVWFDEVIILLISNHHEFARWEEEIQDYILHPYIAMLVNNEWIEYSIRYELVHPISVNISHMYTMSMTLTSGLVYVSLYFLYFLMHPIGRITLLDHKHWLNEKREKRGLIKNEKFNCSSETKWISSEQRMICWFSSFPQSNGNGIVEGFVSNFILYINKRTKLDSIDRSILMKKKISKATRREK